MADLAKLAGYILGVLIAGRTAFILCRRTGDDPDDATFTAVVAGILWPVIAFVAVALSPFIALGWIVSRPTRHDRRAAQAEHARQLAAEYGLPDGTEAPR